MNKNTKINTLEELFTALIQGKKAYNENWLECEFIKFYSFDDCVVDENGDEVNAAILLNNRNQGDFYYK